MVYNEDQLLKELKFYELAQKGAKAYHQSLLKDLEKINKYYEAINKTMLSLPGYENEAKIAERGQQIYKEVIDSIYRPYVDDLKNSSMWPETGIKGENAERLTNSIYSASLAMSMLLRELVPFTPQDIIFYYGEIFKKDIFSYYLSQGYSEDVANEIINNNGVDNEEIDVYLIMDSEQFSTFEPYNLTVFLPPGDFNKQSFLTIKGSASVSLKYNAAYLQDIPLYGEVFNIYTFSRFNNKYSKDALDTHLQLYVLSQSFQQLFMNYVSSLESVEKFKELYSDFASFLVSKKREVISQGYFVDLVPSFLPRNAIYVDALNASPGYYEQFRELLNEEGKEKYASIVKNTSSLYKDHFVNELSLFRETHKIISYIVSDASYYSTIIKGSTKIKESLSSDYQIYKSIVEEVEQEDFDKGVMSLLSTLFNVSLASYYLVSYLTLSKQVDVLNNISPFDTALFFGAYFSKIEEDFDLNQYKDIIFERSFGAFYSALRESSNP